jgi:hypothetical protein
MKSVRQLGGVGVIAATILMTTALTATSAQAEDETAHCHTIVRIHLTQVMHVSGGRRTGSKYAIGRRMAIRFVRG